MLCELKNIDVALSWSVNCFICACVYKTRDKVINIQ